MKRQLVISREIGDRRGEGNHLGNLGEMEKARPLLQQSLAIFEEIKSPTATQARALFDSLPTERKE